MLPFNSDMLLNLDKTIQNKKKPKKPILVNKMLFLR